MLAAHEAGLICLTGGASGPVGQLLLRGDRAGAEALFQSELPYVLWAMQSIDFSVRATKTELLVRRVIQTKAMREPWGHLDATAEAQLARFIAERPGNT
ncbi:MAG TPA: hypothetical protein VFI12_11275, partial [Thermomicrobiales bacterium]|nr:hypothetical protein [Thermomicrobiales bacterium]